MAAAGAISPKSREDSQGIMAFLMIMFALTAPGSMVIRMAITQVPFWQIAVSLIGLVFTAYFMLQLAGRFFRADNLLSDRAFSWHLLATGWKR
jgi:ABC-type Na+ efflux pump permease subunit